MKLKPPLLDVRALSLGLQEGRKYNTIFPPISFRLSNGEVLALVGDSGAGKTSVLNVIAGFIRPKDPDVRPPKQARARLEFLPRPRGKFACVGGDVLIEGHSVMHLPPSARRLGMLLQNFSVFEDRSILDNLTFGALVRGVSKEERRTIARRTFHLLKMNPVEGIDKFLDRPADGLSGGERQRVALVRLVNDRPLLWLLDEPYANLDALRRQEISNDIRDAITALSGEHDVCSVIVCHDLQETRRADKILVLAGEEDPVPGATVSGVRSWALAEKSSAGGFTLTDTGGDHDKGRMPLWIERLSADKILV